jgi:hypothetical protein
MILTGPLPLSNVEDIPPTPVDLVSQIPHGFVVMMTIGESWCPTHSPLQQTITTCHPPCTYRLLRGLPGHMSHHSHWTQPQYTAFLGL